MVAQAAIEAGVISSVHFQKISSNSLSEVPNKSSEPLFNIMMKIQGSLPEKELKQDDGQALSDVQELPDSESINQSKSNKHGVKMGVNKSHDIKEIYEEEKVNESLPYPDQGGR
jgi:hypothetical protein